MDLSGFNAHEVEPRVEFEPIPAGRYLACLIDTQEKRTKANDGSYMECTFEILDSGLTGRRVWARLNLDNQNEKARQIARAELSAICRSVGVMTPQTSEELHNLPIYITVKQEKRNDGDGMTNRITKYESQAAQQQAPNGNGATPPWMRK